MSTYSPKRNKSVKVRTSIISSDDKVSGLIVASENIYDGGYGDIANRNLGFDMAIQESIEIAFGRDESLP